HVAAAAGHLDSARAEPEEARVAIEHRPEDRGRVEAWQAEPLDRPARRDERARLAVRQERVLRDRREWTASLTQKPVRGLEAGHGASVRPGEGRILIDTT